MEISITNEKENKLFGRKEIFFTTSYSGGKTPSREEVKEEICKKLSLNPDMTAVIKITQAYGSNSSEVVVHSYSSKEAMEGLTRKPKEKKADGAAAPQKAAPAEAKAEAKKEAPVEEKEHKEKHDAPKEEKKEALKEKHEPKKEEKKEEAKK